MAHGLLHDHHDDPVRDPLLRLAILANRVQRGQSFFRLAFFVPFVLPSAAISLISLISTRPHGPVELPGGLRSGRRRPSPVLGTPNLGPFSASRSPHLVDDRLQLVSTWPACRTFRASSTRPRPSTAPASGSRSTRSASPCSAGRRPGRAAADHREPQDLRPGLPDEPPAARAPPPRWCWAWSRTPPSPTTGSARARRPRSCCSS